MYCFFSCPLQNVLNTAARVIFLESMWGHVIPLLITLPNLPRTQYKVKVLPPTRLSTIWPYLWLLLTTFSSPTYLLTAPQQSWQIPTPRPLHFRSALPGMLSLNDVLVLCHRFFFLNVTFSKRLFLATVSKIWYTNSTYTSYSLVLVFFFFRT